MRSSITRRLQISLITSLALVWLIAAVSVAWVVKHETEEVFNSSLQEMAQRVLVLASIELDMHLPAGTSLLAPAEHKEYLTYQVFNREGSLLMRSHSAPAEPFLVSSNVGHHRAQGQHFYVEHSRDGRYIIKIAESASHRQETFSAMLFYLMLPFGFALPISALVIYWSVRRSRTDLLQFGREIERRDSKDLAPLDMETLPVEFSSVGESVNSLMRRLQMALESERSFTANSAHELRTPIAAALAQLDVLRDVVKEPGSQERVLVARTMIMRLEQMTVKLLQLARAESGKALNLARMDLNRLTKMLLDDMVYRSQRTFTYQAPNHPIWINGDVDAVGIALQNLLENADKYATVGTNVEAWVSPEGWVTIRNDSDPIPPELLSSLCKRFVRAHQAESGTGIGLSIVSAILSQCDAELVLRSPWSKNGRGFEAVARFKLWTS